MRNKIDSKKVYITFVQKDMTFFLLQIKKGIYKQLSTLLLNYICTDVLLLQSYY